MIKYLFYFSICLITGFGVGQTRTFNERLAPLLEEEDHLLDIESASIENTAFDPISGNYDLFSKALMFELKNLSRNRRFKLQQSTFLQHVALISAEVWSSSYFYSKRSMKNPKKQLKKNLPKTKTKYGLVDCFAFAVPLIKPVKKNDLKYDYRGESGNLNLFIKKKEKNEEGKLEYVKVPVELYTEEEIMQLIMQKIKQRGISQSLREGLYYACGVSVIPDKRTFGKTRIPYARVYIVLGAKRLHFIKE